MPKKIILLTAVHPYKASGRSVTDLKNILKEKGHSVVIITNAFLSEKIDDVISVKSLFTVLVQKISRKIKSKLKIGNIELDSNYYMFDYKSHKTRFDITKILKKLPFKPDAFIYLFQHEFLNDEALFELNKSTGAPIYRYMADMAELTGGCHYAWDCEGYTKNCGNCPGLYSDNPRDETYENLKFKKNFIEKTEIYPIAASEWQMQQLLKSTLYKGVKKYKILLPIDENIFYPQDKIAARNALGLPLDKKIIFFGAVNTLEKRKGAKELMSALESLKKFYSLEKSKEIHLAIAGHADSTFIDQLYFSSTILGYLDYENLAKAYNAADVFVCPSIEDSGPTMMNQSLMCGTPTVSFTMGVALDLVINFETGYRAELGNSSDLAGGINYILTLSENKKENMKNNCYALAKKMCCKNSFYLNFSEILNSKRYL